MAYKAEAPPDKSIFTGSQVSSGLVSHPQKTGYTGYTGYRQGVEEIIDDQTIAVLIDSAVLGQPIWFALVDGWTPNKADGAPIFYATELLALRQKTAEQLRSIFKVKRAFGGGMVRH
jgi:hypothetical protein